MVGAFDMTNGNDRGQLIAALKKKRWDGITDEFKADAMKALRIALRWALDKQDQRAVNGIVNTLGHLEMQNQKDEHKVVDVEHGMTGSVQAGVSVQVVIMPPASVPQVTIQAPAQIEGNDGR